MYRNHLNCTNLIAMVCTKFIWGAHGKISDGNFIISNVEGFLDLIGFFANTFVVAYLRGSYCDYRVKILDSLTPNWYGNIYSQVWTRVSIPLKICGNGQNIS